MGVSQMDVQGHRGCRGLRPQNTLAAFAHAISLGVSTLELDCGLTLDGQVIIAHDPVLNPQIHRLIEDAPISRVVENVSSSTAPRLCDLSLAEIRCYDAGSLRSPGFPDQVRFPGERLPTLEDVLMMVADMGDEAVEFCLEIKYNPEKDLTRPLEEMIDTVLGIIAKHNAEKRFILQCFDLRGLSLIKKKEAKIRTLFLVDNGERGNMHPRDGGPSPWLNGRDWHRTKPNIAAFLSTIDFVDFLGPNFRQLLPDDDSYLGSQVTAIQQSASGSNGIKVIPWTVNEIKDMTTMIDLGVDGMISDYPDRLLQLLKNSNISIKNR